MDAKVREFLQQAERDPALQARVKAVIVDDKDRGFAELAQIARDAGYTVTAEALESGLRECAPKELRDDDLDAVAGGILGPTNLSYTTMTLQTSTFSNFYTQLNTQFNVGVIAPCD